MRIFELQICWRMLVCPHSIMDPTILLLYDGRPYEVYWDTTTHTIQSVKKLDLVVTFVNSKYTNRPKHICITSFDFLNFEINHCIEVQQCNSQTLHFQNKIKLNKLLCMAN